MSREVVLGLDFGTSFSTAAAWVNGRMYLVPDERGEPCLPSLVYVPERGPPEVGYPARAKSIVEPQSVIRGVKRILGRKMEDPAFRLFEAQNSVLTKAAPNGSPILQIAGRELTPVQVAAAIFERLRTLAERRFALPAKKAVLSHPTGASREFMRALKQAARMAGLTVLDTVPEPVAGAMAYGVDQAEGSDRRILVYDFGGGTFDVTALVQEGMSLRPLATAGDGMLGGDDFDEILAQKVNKEVWRQHKVQLDKDVVRWQRVLYQSELVKRALSGAPRVPLRIRDLFSGGPVQDLDLMVLRERLEPSWKPLVDKSLQITAETMVQSGLRPERLNYVVMIGGTTYIPLVQESLAKVLERPGMHIDDPQTAVAAGAAVLAARVLKVAA